MRLSENRIESIALAIVDQLAEDELIDITISEEDVVHLVSAVIAKDLAIEDEIQREAVEWVEINRRHLEQGTSTWHIEVEKQREALARRRGYVLP